MNRSKLNFAERLYLLEVFKGLWLTSRHFFSNMNRHLARQLGFTRIEKGAVTFQYPEERRPFSPRYRSRHRLTTREDGSPRCVACMMCLTFYNRLKSDSNHRYRFWDHCYSFFKKRESFTVGDIHLELFHLAFYLASWGMYRGSSFLLWKDYRIHIPAVQMLLRDRYKPLWTIDFSSIQADSAEVDLVFELVSKLKEPYGNGRYDERKAF